MIQNVLGRHYLLITDMDSFWVQVGIFWGMHILGWGQCADSVAAGLEKPHRDCIFENRTVCMAGDMEFVCSLTWHALTPQVHHLQRAVVLCNYHYIHVQVTWALTLPAVRLFWSLHLWHHFARPGILCCKAVFDIISKEICVYIDCDC